MKLNPQYRYPEKFKDQAIEFFNSYDLEKEVVQRTQNSSKNIGLIFVFLVYPTDLKIR